MGPVEERRLSNPPGSPGSAAFADSQLLIILRRQNYTRNSFCGWIFKRSTHRLVRSSRSDPGFSEEIKVDDTGALSVTPKLKLKQGTVVGPTVVEPYRPKVDPDK
jgi:hypothetical protein